MSKKHKESPHWGKIIANPFNWNAGPAPEPTAAEREYAKKVFSQPDETGPQYITDPDEAQWIITQRAMDILKPRGLHFILDKYNTQLFIDLCLYFTQNPAFKGNLKKGILLMGGYGVGKTFLLSLFANSYPDGCKFAPAYALSHIVTPDQLINQQSSEGRTQIAYGTVQMNRRPKYHNYLLDELGGEVNISPAHIDSRQLTFAELDRTNTIATIIHRRHRIYLETGHLTHLTTNLCEGAQIQALYGGKILSRLTEMCNPIEVTGTDRRK